MLRAGPGFPHRGAIARRFAADVFIGSALVRVVLREFAGVPPIWTIAGMIASVAPQMVVAARMFKSRIVNVLVGCAIGLVFMLIGGSSEWTLPIALAATVFISSYLVRIPTMWRQASIGVASGLTHHSKSAGVEFGLIKVAEALFGCLVGLGTSWLMSRLWPLPTFPDGEPR